MGDFERLSLQALADICAELKGIRDELRWMRKRHARNDEEMAPFLRRMREDAEAQHRAAAVGMPTRQ